MASDACLVTEYHSDFSKYFPNLNLPYFSNMLEAHEQCKKILSDEAYRADIVAQSQDIVNKNHRFINAACEMEKFLNLKLINTNDNVQKDNSNVFLLDELLPKREVKLISPNSCGNLKLKNKIRYKIWHHYNRVLKEKGII